jgi:SOS-response transcriptional repressor LexA
MSRQDQTPEEREMYATRKRDRARRKSARRRAKLRPPAVWPFPLPKREMECLSFVAAFIKEQGRAPLKREIAAHIGHTSRGYVGRVLANLEAKEFIQNRKYFVRGIELRAPAVAVTMQYQTAQMQQVSP